MKSILTSFAVIAFGALALIVTSCSKSNIAVDTAPINPFDFVGQMHNAGLQSVLDGLATTKAEQDLSAVEAEINRLSVEFCESVFNNDPRFEISSFTKSGTIGLPEVQMDTTIGDIATEYLNRIAFVLESDDCAEIASGLLSIESDILSPDASQLSENERTYLLCCLSVGRYSSDFWKEYPQTKAASAKYAIGAIVGADLWGAGEGIFAHGPEILICGVIGGPGCGLAAAARAALVPAITKSAFAGFCAGCGYLAETL